MIEYTRGVFGLNLLFRLHGSAIYKAAFLPGILSVVVFYLYDRVWRPRDPESDLNHPYGVGVLVSSVSFLIIFRANYGYQRYWEATSAIHHMMAKWLDATVHTCAFHLQSSQYEKIKPPTYFDHAELDQLGLTRDREDGNSAEIGMRYRGATVTKSINFVDSTDKRKEAYSTKAFSSSNMDTRIEEHTARYYPSQKTSTLRRSRGPSMMIFGNSSSRYLPPVSASDSEDDLFNLEDATIGNNDNVTPFPLFGSARRDGGWGSLFDDGKNTYYSPSHDDDIVHGRAHTDATTRKAKGLHSFASTLGGRTPPLFLQELAHLSSLVVAVALSTLRNDIEGAESPLGYYHPGSPWPEADPDKIVGLENPMTSFRYLVEYWFGTDRTPRARTEYNEARPLLVMGGVSDNEVAFLQRARGPSAKTQLAWQWLSEFIMREHLAGSLGKVGPPIVSRIIQFLSDGMIYYNHARKIMYVPFPFPHAQLSVFFMLTMILAVPLLMDQYTNDFWLGAVLTFLTVTCLSGLHEVARELENPFRNVPNDLPLVTLGAQYNEALVTMYAGYHPDFFWNANEVKAKKEEVERGSMPKKRRPRMPPTPSMAGTETKEDAGPVPNMTQVETNSTSSSETLEVSQNMSLDELRNLLVNQVQEIERLRNMVEARVAPPQGPTMASSQHSMP